MRARLFVSLLALTALPSLGAQASTDWVNQDAAGTDVVEVKFDSDEPHEVNKKMLRLISYGTEEGCQLTTSFTRTHAAGWHVGYVKGASGSGKDQPECAFPNGEIVKTNDIVMYRTIDDDTMEVSVGGGEKGEPVMKEMFSGIFKMKEE